MVSTVKVPLSVSVTIKAVPLFVAIVTLSWTRLLAICVVPPVREIVSIPVAERMLLLLLNGVKVWLPLSV